MKLKPWDIAGRSLDRPGSGRPGFGFIGEQQYMTTGIYWHESEHFS